MGTRPQRGRGRPRGRGRDRADFGTNPALKIPSLSSTAVPTVVKGGRRFSFGALVVVGDRKGQVGFGYGRRTKCRRAVEKGIKQARRSMFPVPLRGNTIPHRVIGRSWSKPDHHGAGAKGTGVIAGAAPRAVLELAGVKNVLTKCYGSTSPKNLVKATINGLKLLRTRAMVEKLRGVALDLPGRARR